MLCSLVIHDISLRDDRQVKVEHITQLARGLQAASFHNVLVQERLRLPTIKAVAVLRDDYAEVSIES